MTATQLEAEIREHLHRLPFEQQRRVLEFARALANEREPGIPGASLLRFAGTLDAADLAEMKQAIEDGCEVAHGDDW
jgi:hypothetical protein